VALPERACGLAETARVLTWMARQSAGQCGPCVHGLAAIAADFEAIAYGGGGREVLPRLRDRLSIVTGRGACGLPDGAVRFAASALTVFGDHVLVHQRQGGCLAARRRRGWTLPLPLPASAREAS
jgi:NADH:ubiquinone oxidoreductase subunit F (NADH-binding)